ncbi:MAG: SMP-30/gluconolactonase/LRE family protein [Bacteroidales bacterium]|nr:SMP-30/gluconolactonase/LRE family protein [Bacteroidales bacterium]MBN2698908.1 SMP-30/gluconolactonase/LRE family protein [Bacteroidales bacterium]
MKNHLIFPFLLFIFLACNRNQTDLNVGTLHAESDAFYEVVPKDAIVERMGVNFQFTEGPAWYGDGFLLFSDIPANRIYMMKGRNFEVFREPSGNSNGLIVTRDGTVIACEHGSRSITGFSREGALQTIADRFKGARFNSPNDLCISSSGVIYFTDPPYGLPQGNDDPSREIDFNGVFMIKDGEVMLIDSTLSWPNGIALSSEEDYLYVANFEPAGPNGASRDVFWLRYMLDEKGEATGKSRFFTAPDPSLKGGPDGMRVDRNGNLFVTGPGGVLIIDPDGKYLGRIELPESPTNLAFGPREKELYITARSTVLKVNLK